LIVDLAVGDSVLTTILRDRTPATAGMTYLPR
jgi:hypothetical protein